MKALTINIGCGGEEVRDVVTGPTVLNEVHPELLHDYTPLIS